MLTGLHPARHGVRTNDGFRLAPGVPTLAGSAAPPRLRHGRVHRRRVRSRRPSVSHAASTATTTSFFARSGDASNVRRTKSSAPRSPGSMQHRSQSFFAWLHLFDPHSPYTPPEPFATAHAGAPYDGEVAYTDAAIGRLFDHLQRSGLFSRRRHPRRRRSWRVARRARRAHARHVSLRRDGSRAAARQASRHGGLARSRPSPSRRPTWRRRSRRYPARGSTPCDGQNLLPLLTARTPQPAILSGPRTPSRTTRTSCSAGVRCERCGPADGSSSRRRDPSCTIWNAIRAS